MSMRRIAFGGLAAWLMLTALPAFAAMRETPVDWTVGSQRFSGVLVYDDAGGKRPGLVMVPNWKGVNASAVEKGKLLAGKDYVVLVADVYGSGVRPASDAEAGKLAGALKADPATLRTRIAKAVDVLKAQAGKAPLDAVKIGAVGYCFGGTTVLELARSGAQLAGIVTLHGNLATPEPAKEGAVKTPLLVLNGGADRYVSTDEIEGFWKEMDTAGADWQFVSFSGAVHCFAEPDANSGPGCQYDARAAKRAYRMLHDFFAERFAATERASAPVAR